MKHVLLQWKAPENEKNNNCYKNTARR